MLAEKDPSSNVAELSGTELVYDIEYKSPQLLDQSFITNKKFSYNTKSKDEHEEAARPD